MKIRILHAISSLNVGGMERALVSLVDRLDYGKFEWQVICIGEGPLADSMRKCGHEVLELKKKPRRAGIAAMIGLASGLKRFRPDIVHCHGFAAGLRIGLVAPFIGRPSVLRAFHGLNLERPSGLIWLDRFLSRTYDTYVVVSEARKRLMIARQEADPVAIRVIYNGVDGRLFSPGEDGTAIRRLLGIPCGAPVVGTVASMTPVKDQKTLLRAAAKVVHNFPGAYFLLVGDGPLRDELISLAEEMNIRPRIIFAGRRQDIPDVLRTLDIFVMSSISEDNSVALLEATAAGLPAVVTDVGGNPEITIPGRTGFLVPPRDSEALADRITTLIADADLRRKMGAQARTIFEGRFSLEKMVSSYEALYDEMKRGRTSV